LFTRRSAHFLLHHLEAVAGHAVELLELLRADDGDLSAERVEVGRWGEGEGGGG
jgi:hypothetical protein